MGITANCAKFLLYAKTKGVDFSDTVMLGRQQLFLSELERATLGKEFHSALRLPKNGDFAEEFFRVLGATTIESMDYSDFEQATIIHNLNEQIPQAQVNKYSTVFDGGTLEHVFNFPVAIKNCMDMLQVGGHFVSITPTNNQSGHGFYQFSPELFFSLFTVAYGFKLKLVAMGVELPSKGITEWFEVKDPKSVGGRVMITNSYPTSLLIIAEKIAPTENISLNPFQSDYHHIWNVHNAISNDVQVEGEGKWVHLYRRWTPEFIKKVIRKLRNPSGEQTYVKDLGLVNPFFFTKMDV